MSRTWSVVAMVAMLGCEEARPGAVDAPCVPSETRSCSRIHGPGVLDPTSADFHGALLAREAYDLATCASCHEPAGTGGTSGVSCRSCHAEGTTACATCHAKIAEQGAHGPHLDAPRAIGCDDCHHVPTRFVERGHVRLASGEIDPPPAEVMLAGGARYDATAGACSDVSCHGSTLSGSADRPLPVWTTSPGTTACTTCHGAPPTSHASDRCGDCHGDDVRTAGSGRASHIDGVITLGDGSGTCLACHDPADRGHLDHASARRALAAPIACDGCHLVPDTVEAAGHIDSAPPAEVFPAGFAGLAAARGAQPSYQTGTCANTYCHGTGEVVWGGSDQTVFCGSCHGIPPADADHQPAWTLTDCARCHARTVGPRGELLFPDDRPSSHLDGVVDR